LAELAKPFLAQAGVSTDGLALNKIIAIEKQRLTTLAELPERVRSYAELPAYEPSLLVWKKSDPTEARERLNDVRALLESLPEDRYAEAKLLEASVKEYIEGKGLKNGPVLWPTRVALSGKDASPGPFELAWALGKAETVRRLDAAIKSLQT
jgi:glutamyl-tRNA synthetase